MRRERPWRAIAYLQGGSGAPRITLGRTSAVSRPGLDRFLDRWQAFGATVDVWEVQSIPEVDQLAATAPSPPVPSGP